MKKAADLTNQALVNCQKSSESDKLIKQDAQSLSRNKAERVAIRLWERFASLYGYTFTRQFGVTPDGTWITCLDGITPDQLATGLRLALEKHPEYPPGAAQFRALCLPEKGSWEHNSAAYKESDPSKLLADFSDHPELKAKADKARIKAMEKIRGESNE